MGTFVTTLTTDGQVVLPEAIRADLSWNPGTRLTVEQTGNGVLLRAETALFPPTKPEDVFGCLRYDGSPKSLEEMDAAIATEVMRRHARGRY